MPKSPQSNNLGDSRGPAQGNSEASTVFLDQCSDGSTGARKVTSSDDQLLQLALRVHEEMDRHERMQIPEEAWRWKREKKNFQLFSRKTDHGATHEVLTTGEIAGVTVEDLAVILCTPSESEYNALMKGLYGKHFIYGSLVHVVRSDRSLLANQLTVKTSTFVGQHLFARNEQSCFLEFFQPLAHGEGFTITYASIDPNDVTAGRAAHDYVDQLHNITAEVFVEQIPNQKSVRVHFYGRCEPTGPSINSNHPQARYGSTKKSRGRLLNLAKGVCNLAQMAQRRRAAQVAGEYAHAGNNSNSYCIACTKKLTIFTKKTSCQLCAYTVCAKCCSREKMETSTGYIQSMLLCKRCVDSDEFTSLHIL